MSLHLFAGLRVRGVEPARARYEQLLGEPCGERDVKGFHDHLSAHGQNDWQ